MCARILLVDDDASSRSALEKLLRADGYDVSVAGDGEAALAQAERALPDLVLTDLEMPRMHGAELCRRIHELDRALPVIVMTAHSGLGSAVDSLRAGAEDYLVKPLQYDAVLWQVQRTLARRAVTKLHEQQREECLALISHDLLNPLSCILMGTSLLRDSLQRQGLRTDLELADRIQRNATRMAAMLDDLREATGLETKGVTVHLEPCGLRDLVAGVVDGMGDAPGRRISLASDETVPHLVLAEALRLERVITNLLTNALKYSADDAPVEVQILRAGDMIQLAIVDHGIGIPPESIGLLFDRYYRTAAGKARAGGLGLGLYISRLIVETHGGRIDVSSVVGRGSTFKVTLPSHAVSS